jgi:AcrR family transcriptional regulator
MPYTPAHKARTRERILDSARRLFMRSGYERVTIEAVMADAGLTRGGFYNHFAGKAELFAAAVDGYVRTTPWEADDGGEPSLDAPDLARWFIDFYLSDGMLAQRELQCPLFALPGDVSRAGGAPQAAYTRLIERTVAVFRAALPPGPGREAKAEAIVALCVGAMLLASTTDDAGLRRSLRRSAKGRAVALLDG